MTMTETVETRVSISVEEGALNMDTYGDGVVEVGAPMVVSDGERRVSLMMYHDGTIDGDGDAEVADGDFANASVSLSVEEARDVASALVAATMEEIDNAEFVMPEDE